MTLSKQSTCMTDCPQFNQHVSQQDMRYMDQNTWDTQAMDQNKTSISALCEFLFLTGLAQKPRWLATILLPTTKNKSLSPLPSHLNCVL